MDCRKRNRARALFQSAICFGTPKLGACGLAHTESAATTNAKPVKSAPASHQPPPSPGRRQLDNFTVALAPLLKLPAKVLLAVLLAYCVCVPLRTVHGQVPQGASQVEVQQLIEQLAQADFDLREAAERQLIEIGSPAVDPLVRALLGCTPDVCSRAKRILQTVASECDEESLFKVLAALRIRFEVPAQRIKPLLDRWAIQNRDAVVARWREQGAIVSDPFGPSDPRQQLDQFAFLENRILDRAPREVFRLQVGADGAAVVTHGPRESLPKESSPQVSESGTQAVSTQSIAERLQLVLDGSLEQNKELVLSSRAGADGFDQSLAKLQKQPVSVTIGEDWRGDYSIFECTGSPSDLLISSLEVQNKVVNDSLLSVLNKHPLASLTLNECSIAADVTQALPASLSSLVIEGADNSTDLIKLISSNSTALSQVRLVSSNFGKAQAKALRQFERLTTIDLVRIDLEQDAFEGLASIPQLRRVWLERCKFPAAAFLDFKKSRREVGVDFTAKAFLGVSSAPARLFGRVRQLELPAADGKAPAIIPQGREEQPQRAEPVGCVITTVVPGEAADRAGMKAGDEILTIAGQKVKSFEELRISIAQCQIGEEVSIVLLRDGEEKTLQATMGVPDDLK